VPASVERTLGERTLQVLDQRMLAASKLAPERQKRLGERFAALSLAERDAPGHELLFRKSRIGPNALALPSGRIVVTDELAELLADDEDALMAVLAHELGHLHKRHLMRRLVHGAATSAAGLALFGDASGLVAALPALLLDLKYSREAELEADDYAAALMKANGLSAGHLASALERLAHDGNSMPAYLSSHPDTAERIARLRAMR
jgi:Zn-dependent protease with chaperone function